ncbi:hypothetical protein GH733_007012 [Mirounga leonina]|nr:hypothetical protein GH733_007012 [Mirounga leonina]
MVSTPSPRPATNPFFWPSPTSFSLSVIAPFWYASGLACGAECELDFSLHMPLCGAQTVQQFVVQYLYRVFCRLRPGISVLALHGRQQQMRRMEVYNDFVRKRAAVLFATDIAARGLEEKGMVQQLLQKKVPVKDIKSLGLAVAPRVRFLQKMQKQPTKELVVSQDNKVIEPRAPSLTNDEVEEFRAYFNEKMSILQKGGKRPEGIEYTLANGISDEEEEKEDEEEMEEKLAKAKEPQPPSVPSTGESKEAPGQFLDRDEEEEDGHNADFFTVKRHNVFGLDLQDIKAVQTSHWNPSDRPISACMSLGCPVPPQGPALPASRYPQWPHPVLTVAKQCPTPPSPILSNDSKEKVATIWWNPWFIEEVRAWDTDYDDKRKVQKIRLGSASSLIFRSEDKDVSSWILGVNARDMSFVPSQFRTTISNRFGSEMSLDLKDSIRGDLGEVVHGDSAASGQGVALVSTCHDQQLVGHRSLENASVPGVALPHRDNGELVQDDGPAYGGGYLLGVRNTQTDKSVVVLHGDKCLESSPLSKALLMALIPEQFPAPLTCVCTHLLYHTVMYRLYNWGRSQLLAPGPDSFKMSTVHEILCKLSLESDHSTPPSAYGSVKAYTNFDAERDALNIETAIRTKGVDEVTIVNILTNRSNEQRQDIAFAYQRRTKKELASALKSALSGHLETVILGLLKTPAQYDASELKASLKGLGTDEDYLIEIICSRTNQELQEINRVYKEMYKTDLEKDIVSDTSGDFHKLMVALAKGKGTEDGSVIDYELIDQDARDLYGAGVKRKGTDVPKWISIMTEQSDVVESIKKEVKGDLENAFLNLVQCIQNKPLYFADQLYDSMKGKGTRDKVLIRIMVSRSEVDMLKIRSEFKRKYGKSLYYYIQQDTKGDYQKALLYLCGGDD